MVLTLVWVLVLRWGLNTGDNTSSSNKASSNPSLKSLPSLEELYGPQWDGMWPAGLAAGPSQLLVLSYYQTKASLLARLLMLMGVFAGEAAQLRIDAHNQLRWWELHQLTTLNDLMLSAHAAPGLPPHLARGFHVSALTADERDYYTDRLAGIVKYLGQHKPWLIKDPRLSWLAPLWMEQLEAPLCVLLVDMQPQALAQHLAQQQQERQLHSQQAQLEGRGGEGGSSSSSDGELVVSSATHLERWTNATLSSLKACFGVPTLIIPNSVLQWPLLLPFVKLLQQHLRAAGVQGTRMPPPELMHEQFIAHMQQGANFTSHCTGDQAAADGSTVDSDSLLARPCYWLPPKPQSGSGAVQGGRPSGPDTSLLPLPTQALLSALHDHLSQNLPQPAESTLQYSRAAGDVYTAYASRVKQLVAQRGVGLRQSEHAGIGTLIVEALKHVQEAKVSAASRTQRQRERLL